MKKIAVIGASVLIVLLMVAAGTVNYQFSEDSRTEGELIGNKCFPMVNKEEGRKKEKPLGERPEKGWTIGFSNIGNDMGYYSEVEKVLRGYVEQDDDSFVSMNAKGNGELQTEQLYQMIDMGVDAVFIIPVDEKSISPVLDKMQEKNIPVVVINRNIEKYEKIVAVVDSDSFNAGFILADYMINQFKGGKDFYQKEKVVVFFEKGDSSGKEKIYGFRMGISRSLFKVEKEIKCSHDKEELREQLKAAVEEIKDLKYIFSVCDEMTLSLLEICEEENYEELKIFSVGGSPKIKRCMAEKNQSLAAIAAESPISLAMSAYTVMNQYLEGEKVKKEYLTETFLVTKDNIGDYSIETWQ